VRLPGSAFSTNYQKLHLFNYSASYISPMASKQKELPKRESMPAPKIPDVSAEPRILTPNVQRTLDVNLLKAAKRKEWERMGSLLDAGAKADERTAAGFSALTYAAAEGQTTLVKKIIESGVEVSIRDFASRIAFTEAIAGKHKETAGLLIEAGKLGAGNSVIPVPYPLTPEQEEAIEEIEEMLFRGGKVWG
jgi:ankyrin repeat protein